MTKDQWADIEMGLAVEVSEEDFNYFLDALPPAFMYRNVELMSGVTVYADYGFVEGADRVTAFFRHEGKFYAAATTLISRGN